MSIVDGVLGPEGPDAEFQLQRLEGAGLISVVRRPQELGGSMMPPQYQAIRTFRRIMRMAHHKRDVDPPSGG